MKQGIKNTGIRESNIESILHLLYIEKMSVSKIAKELHLSKTAVIKILAEMESMNIVQNVALNTSENEKWKRTLYTIKKDAGVITIIEFGSTYVKVVFSYLNGDIFDETYLEDKEFLTLEHLSEIEKIIKDKQKTLDLDGIRMIATIISAPGQINKFKDEIENSFKFKLIKEVAIRNWFETRINMPVLLKNDINLAIIGEQLYGNTDRIAESGILIYIDSGIGGAILNENKIIEGDFGYAAEFGLVETHDQFGNKLVYDLICSINSIKKQIAYKKFIGEQTSLEDKFRYKDVVKAFLQKDSLTVDVIKQTAIKMSELIGNLYNIFNYRQFFIGGRIKSLGHTYLEWIKEGLNGYNSQITVKYTTLDDESIVYGAIHVGLTYAYKVIAKNNKE